jgi:hypothetical protein
MALSRSIGNGSLPGERLKLGVTPVIQAPPSG